MDAQTKQQVIAALVDGIKYMDGVMTGAQTPTGVTFRQNLDKIVTIIDKLESPSEDQAEE